PFTESTILSFENPLHEINILKIFNMQGQIVREYSNVKGNEIKIDREKMNDGIYFFLIMNEKRIVANGSLIIN
nr:T9SS type A sorting domain-containing protein [Bacteroidia bacterium]